MTLEVIPQVASIGNLFEVQLHFLGNDIAIRAVRLRLRSIDDSNAVVQDEHVPMLRDSFDGMCLRQQTQSWELVLFRKGTHKHVKTEAQATKSTESSRFLEV